MKILFISKDLIAGNIACQLQKEGHKVKLFIDEKHRRKNLTNLVQKCSNWKKELKWVGKDGLIIFDDVGYGKEQEWLRISGYTVFGGGLQGDLLETNRVFGDKIFKKYGLQTRPIYNFKSINKAIVFLKKNKGPWVIKQNDNAPKTLNYVGLFEDNQDTIGVLENYKKINFKFCKVITLHKKIEGIEIAASRHFNGRDWIGPIEINMEHKKFFPGNIGPTTSEMGTIAWYDNNEDNKLFKNTLNKIKPFLQEIDYRGVIDINCIINESDIFPLEVTARFGSPIIHLQHEAYSTQWGNDMGEYYYKIASGEYIAPKFNAGFGIVILISIPPFPYATQLKDHSCIGQKIYFKNLSQEEFRHVHFEEVSLDKKKMEHYISDDRGYILYVSSFDQDFKNAKKKAYDLVEKIHIPKMIYRNDIGDKFLNENMVNLKKMGYLK